MKKIVDSNLYEHVDQIYINCIGSTSTNPFSYLKKVIFHHNESGLETFEISTQEIIHKFSKETPKYNVLYLHTKGVGKEINECIEDWVNYMAYFLIEKWRTCVQELESNDTIGVDLRPQPVLHYSGNFWWARSEYLATLPSPTEYKTHPNPLNSERHNQEFWICHRSEARHKALWDCGINCYERHLHRYPLRNYSNNNFL